MANVYDIIIRPIITERSMEATGTKKYVFEVAPTAGKIEIKNAVEQIFGVKVAKVNTINYDGKAKRHQDASPELCVRVCATQVGPLHEMPA